jgi:predicted Holliday junction resolvase-like endonuclease
MTETLFLIALALALAIIAYFLWQSNSSLKRELEDLQFAKSSQSVKYGKMSENWIPLSEQFPYNSESFRFLGNPIDGVAFENDRIVFCEFKANKAGLNEKQKRIKELVEGKKVEWLEMKMK